MRTVPPLHATIVAGTSTACFQPGTVRRTPDATGQGAKPTAVAPRATRVGASL